MRSSSRCELTTAKALPMENDREPTSIAKTSPPGTCSFLAADGISENSKRTGGIKRPHLHYHVAVLRVNLERFLDAEFAHLYLR